MQRSFEETGIFSPRYREALAIVGMMWLVTVSGGYLIYTNQPTSVTGRSLDELSRGEQCEVWRHDSQIRQLIEGPDKAGTCREYLAHRSRAEVAEDEARWDTFIDKMKLQWRGVGEAAPE